MLKVNVKIYNEYHNIGNNQTVGTSFAGAFICSYIEGPLEAISFIATMIEDK